MTALQCELFLTATAATAFLVAGVLAVIGLVRSHAVRDRVIVAGTAFGAALVVAALLLRGIRVSRLPAFGQFEAMSWYALALAGSYLYLELKHGVRGIGAFVVPCLALVVIAALPAAGSVVVDPGVGGVLLPFHVVAAFVGYGLFTMESVLAAAYLVQDRNLKRKQLGTVFHRLPSLGVLDQLMQELIGAAFLVFSVSIVLGAVLAVGWHKGTQWLTDPKIAATVVTWLVYAVLFSLRVGGHRHGRKVALVALLGLGCVLFSFLGVHLVSDSMHDFVTSAAGAR